MAACNVSTSAQAEAKPSPTLTSKPPVANGKVQGKKAQKKARGQAKKTQGRKARKKKVRPTRIKRDRPNIVMVMADDMRVDDLQFAPAIRRHLGRNGVAFANSFSSFPLCCPSRASFLTGTHAHNHGVYWHNAPYGYGAFDDTKTIATSLTQSGYNTGFIGKYLNGYGNQKAKATGKKSYTYVPNGWTDWRAALDNPNVKGIKGGTYNYFQTPYNVNGKIDLTRYGQYSTNTLGDFAVDMVEGFAGRKKPFFMYVSAVAPHHGGPREKDDPSVVDRADGTYDGFSTPARPDWVKGKFNKVITRPSGLPKGGGPSEADISDKPVHLFQRPDFNAAERAALIKVTRQRAEAIYVLDRQVKRLIRTLKATGEWKNTVMMFTSDNGYFLGEHRRPTGKVLSYEPVLRVPFLVTGPRFRKGETRYDPISNLDVSATIVDIANARAPYPSDGTSKWATITKGDTGWTQPVLYEAMYTGKAKGTRHPLFKNTVRTALGSRTHRYSYTIYKNGDGDLYDLYNDPAQMDNLWTDPRHRGLRDQFTELVATYRDCVGNECSIPLPANLQGTPSEVKKTGSHYWRTINNIYGRNRR